MNSKLLAEITIPKFITKVQISKKARPKYYKKGKKIPPTYEKKYRFNSKGFLVDADGERIIANSRTAGKAKYEVLSGNKLISGYGSPFMRANLVRGLKDFYRPFVQEYVLTHGPITEFPIQVTWDIYTVVEDNPEWDASNLSFYYKYFEDSLFEKTDEKTNQPQHNNKKLVQLIPDDSIKYITWAAAPKIIPIDDWEKRKFVFKLYYDERKELKRLPWLQGTSSNSQ